MGAEGRDRTGDLTITNRLLYQLSYLGANWTHCSIASKKLSNRPQRIRRRTGKASRARQGDNFIG